VVTAAAPEVPAALVAQLAPGGRLVIPVGEREQELRLLVRTPSGIETRASVPVQFVPLVVGREPAARHASGRRWGARRGYLPFAPTSHLPGASNQPAALPKRGLDYFLRSLALRLSGRPTPGGADVRSRQETDQISGSRTIA